MSLNPHVLVVEDNPVNMKLTCEILVADGFRVEQACTAEDALTKLQNCSPDLILMDVALPCMDGLTLTRLLKADARFELVPIVALTASAMRGDADRVLSAGCCGYISKPIDTRALAREVRRHLRSSAAE